MTDIFISYSHKDEAWKDELQAHLRVLQRHGEFSVWDDRQIRLGDNWLPEIEKAITQAKVAILLVSRDFLTSDFIAQEEIAKFLQLRKENGLRVIPVIVRPCPWQAVPWLAELQGATKDNEPLSRHALGSHELEAELSQVAMQVFGYLLEVRAEEEAEAQRNNTKVLQAKMLESWRIEAARQTTEEEQHKVDRQQQEAEKTKKDTERQTQRPPPTQPLYDRSKPLLGLGKTMPLVWLGFIALITVIFLFNRYSGTNPTPVTANAQNTPETVKTAEIAQATVEHVKLEPTVVEPTKPTTTESVATTRLDYEPEMVRIAGGEFQMGCVSGKGCESDEKPVHKVTVPAFEIGKYEVTFAQWDECVAQKGCKHKPEDRWGRGNQPVIRVSWEDAQEYVAWLSRKTGKQYRLPSEAEWEFAARAGTTTPFFTGNCINTDQANYNGNYGWDAADCPKTNNYREKTLSVGNFAGNDFGLFDMHGNVWEWVQDCYHETYQKAPTNQTSWESDCYKFEDGTTARVLRGGSWVFIPEYLRSANRYWLKPSLRYYFIGFRIARTL